MFMVKDVFARQVRSSGYVQELVVKGVVNRGYEIVFVCFKYKKRKCVMLPEEKESLEKCYDSSRL